MDPFRHALHFKDVAIARPSGPHSVIASITVLELTAVNLTRRQSVRPELILIICLVKFSCDHGILQIQDRLRVDVVTCCFLH